jgi:hypothetical protein
MFSLESVLSKPALEKPPPLPPHLRLTPRLKLRLPGSVTCHALWRDMSRWATLTRHEINASRRLQTRPRCYESMGEAHMSVRGKLESNAEDSRVQLESVQA